MSRKDMFWENTTAGGIVGRLGSHSHVYESSYTGTVTGYSSNQNFNGGGDPKILEVSLAK